ncbi:stage III sporulation protein AF [Paenibacillus sedimenti]|uniref:Stage III sporulation protein AF n=1 Tax=Paenibacillus sedimenti TaxID=2770274 RepID=A0A926QIK1_9BACL|nr:stage III sporulation protein AF [Paenibacillus sedimenti]MBD0380726.1 stage III sporulation protein AF [Paenibacillus sedimenti]
MDWLGGWLQAVIMVIMLATFVDLLLPSNTMQRYVKTVMSLFVLLTLLSPVMQLIKKDWNVDELITSAEKKQNEVTMLAGGGGNNYMKSLDAITKEAQKLHAEGQKQSEQMVQTQLAALMKEDLQKQTDMMVKDVQVLAQFDNNGKPGISKVWVTLNDIETTKKPQAASHQKSIAVMEPVKPIDPIRIESGTKLQGSILSQVNAVTEDELTPRQEQERERMARGIARDWQVEPAQIDIRFQQSNGTIAR